ncbi:MAG: PrsW family intramembrane metalloprotease [Kiritimatiellae bacterium]|nr:PrsW family intramembrane metalloprotease [Kiritimatiellia bacterium]
MASGIEDEPALAGTSRAEDNGADAIGDEAALIGMREAELDRLRQNQQLQECWTNPPCNGNALRFLVLCLASGIFAVICTFAKGEIGLGVLAMVVGAPVVEEMAKIILPMMWLEKKPWCFRYASTIFLSCLVSAFVFASIENLLYFFVYLPKFKLLDWIILYRLFVCTAVHVGCTIVSACGLTKAWRKSRDGCGRFSAAVATPYLVTAMILHGIHNAAVTFFSLLQGE